MGLFRNRREAPAGPGSSGAAAIVDPRVIAAAVGGAREAAEIDAMKDLQDARRALEQATALTARARIALQDATAHHELARREVRRISELGRVR